MIAGTRFGRGRDGVNACAQRRKLCCENYGTAGAEGNGSDDGEESNSIGFSSAPVASYGARETIQNSIG